jgi:hypothetical protein
LESEVSAIISLKKYALEAEGKNSLNLRLLRIILRKSQQLPLALLLRLKCHDILLACEFSLVEFYGRQLQIPMAKNIVDRIKFWKTKFLPPKKIRDY